MKVELEEKKVAAIIDEFRVEGKIHIPQGGRVSDFFNVPKKSLVITEARIFFHQENKLLYQVEYIVLNREQIKGIFPID